MSSWRASDAVMNFAPPPAAWCSELDCSEPAVRQYRLLAGSALPACSQPADVHSDQLWREGQVSDELANSRSRPGADGGDGQLPSRLQMRVQRGCDPGCTGEGWGPSAGCSPLRPRSWRRPTRCGHTALCLTCRRACPVASLVQKDSAAQSVQVPSWPRNPPRSRATVDFSSAVMRIPATQV